VLYTLLVLLSLMSPEIDPQPKYKVWIENHEVWMQTSAGPRRVTYDAGADCPVAITQSGDKVAYTVRDKRTVAPGIKPSDMVVVIGSEGQSLNRFTPDVLGFDHLEWIDENRLGVMLPGHANCVYWVVDARTGKTLHEYFGGFDFLWSHDRQHVARRALGPITAQDENGDPLESDDFASLIFSDDGKRVYPPEDPKTGRPYERILRELTWSPDDAWVSFAEVENSSGDTDVVLVSPQGEVLRESLPVDVEYNAKIVWTDDSHFQISLAKRTFKFVVEGGKLREVTEAALH
jgi:hypothetical protein